MPLSTYLKPDVEVLQEFRNLNPIILRATLQSIIVGPSFKKIKDFFLLVQSSWTTRFK
jgi:hypothetical protein